MAITTTTAGWDRSTSQPAAMPILNYNLAPSLAPYPDPSLSSSSSSGLSARQQWHTPTDSSNRSRDTTTLRRERELLEAAGPVTYTPATHRISKAKKGKRVHLCQFAGCNKVSARENRVREEDATTDRPLRPGLYSS